MGQENGFDPSLQVAGSFLVMQVKVNEGWYENMLSVKNEWVQ